VGLYLSAFAHGAIPTQVFEDEQTVHGATISLKHYAPAHTDSDISVHFTDADILHVSDTFLEQLLPVHRLLNRRQY
jgi:glyoxylase-like metal-dependent hydrolase (beta-lactamase superfamily II)